MVLRFTVSHNAISCVFPCLQRNAVYISGLLNIITFMSIWIMGLVIVFFTTEMWNYVEKCENESNQI